MHTCNHFVSGAHHAMQVYSVHPNNNILKKYRHISVFFEKKECV
jgi:hypothetical protein